MLLDQLSDAEKPLPHVRSQSIEFLDDSMIEDLHVPGHGSSYLKKEMRPAPSPGPLAYSASKFGLEAQAASGYVAISAPFR
jgi:hypothetical protein